MANMIQPWQAISEGFEPQRSLWSFYDSAAAVGLLHLLSTSVPFVVCMREELHMLKEKAAAMIVLKRMCWFGLFVALRVRACL